eukprot:m.1247628 g.1247628  ORF g.1247628 m.1247628 type:complete len:71 (+) comp24692_c0_seq3:5942-6154(+)
MATSIPELFSGNLADVNGILSWAFYKARSLSVGIAGTTAHICANGPGADTCALRCVRVTSRLRQQALVTT